MNRQEYRHILKSLNFRPNDRKSLFVLFLNLVMFLSALYCLVSTSLSVNLLGGILLGIQMHHSYVIVHECTHSSFVRYKPLNILLGHVLGASALLPFFNRKYEHLDHHVWTGNVHKEPATKRAMSQFHIESSFKSLLLQICWMMWIPIFTLNEHKNLWLLPFTAENSLTTKKKREQCWISMVVTLASAIFVLLMAKQYATIQNGLAVLVAIYIFFLMIEVFNLPHHVDSELYDDSQARPLWEHDVLSKSCEKIPFGIGTFYMLNFNFHIEHHFFPALPWIALETAHLKLVAFDCKYKNLVDEIKWNKDLRRNSVKKVFEKYYAYMKTQQIIKN